MTLIEQIRAEAARFRAKADKLDAVADELEADEPAKPGRVSSARRQSGATRRGRTPFDQHPKYPEAKRLWESGEKLPGIAERIGLPATTVSNWRSRGKWPKRRG